MTLNMSDLKSVMKIDFSDRKDIFLICNYDEHKKYLKIILLDENENKAFRGFASDIDLRSQAAIIHMVFTDFISLTMKALTKAKHNSDKFLYSMEKNCEGLIFKWKTVNTDETIITIGNVKVSESDYGSSTNEALLLLSEEMANLKEQLAVMNENLDSLKKEMDNSKHLLTNVNATKEKVESELYSKFILILNEKKQEIKELKRKISDSSSGKAKKKQTPSNSKKLHYISDSSNENTSNEEDMDVAGPSTSKRNSSLLFLDEDVPSLAVSPSKKRNRIQRNADVKNNAFQGNKSPIPMESESDDELMKFL